MMTVYKEVHPKSNIARLYVPWYKGGSRLIECKIYILNEENSLGWYVK